MITAQNFRKSKNSKVGKVPQIRPLVKERTDRDRTKYVIDLKKLGQKSDIIFGFFESD